MHRDTLASHVGHYDQLSFYAVAQNESIGRVRAQMIEKMVQPCGP
jgi:splicing factor 3B subunit 5